MIAVWIVVAVAVIANLIVLSSVLERMELMEKDLEEMVERIDVFRKAVVEVVNNSKMEEK